jgi:large subunit ribosomal protein L10
MARPDKLAAVKELAGMLSSSEAVFLTDFTGLDVEAITELRRQLRDESVGYRVVKNTLAKLAVDQAGLSELRRFLEGPTGIAYTDGDIGVPARVLVGFANRSDERPRIKSGFAEGRLLTAEEVHRLATLPSREILLAQVLSAVQVPLGCLVGALQGLLRSLTGSLAALAEKRKKDAEEMS